MIQFLLLVNKQGQTRLSNYYEWVSAELKTVLEGEIVRKCLSRGDNETSFMEYKDYKIAYRRYASLFFIIGFDGAEENELSMLELIHTIVESLDKYFENVCELDIMFNLDKAYFLIDEIIMDGVVVETNKTNILAPVKLLNSK